MSFNVFELPRAPHWRVLVAHKDNGVRHTLRSLIESSNIAVIEAGEGEAALGILELSRFHLLVLQLDLPVRDGVTVMQVHRLLLAHQRPRVDPPAVIFSLAPEVRSNATLTDYLLGLGAYGFIDDVPQPEVVGLVHSALQTRSLQLSGDNPAVG